LLPIKQWNRGRGVNPLGCLIVSVAHGSALCIAKERGAVSKPALEHVIGVNLAMNFQEINRSGGSRGLVAGRIVLNLYDVVSVVQSPCASSTAQALPSVLVLTGGGDSEYSSVAYSTSVLDRT
jgi:hypothetical protein